MATITTERTSGSDSGHSRMNVGEHPGMQSSEDVMISVNKSSPPKNYRVRTAEAGPQLGDPVVMCLGPFNSGAIGAGNDKALQIRVPFNMRPMAAGYSYSAYDGTAGIETINLQTSQAAMTSASGEVILNTNWDTDGETGVVAKIAYFRTTGDTYYIDDITSSTTGSPTSPEIVRAADDGTSISIRFVLTNVTGETLGYSNLCVWIMCMATDHVNADPAND